VSTTDVEAVPYLRRLHEELGVATVIFTDIARDGMFTAPDTETLEQLLDISPSLTVIASGGVGELAHVIALKELNRPNLLGVIVGKALYDGRLDLTKAVNALK
jgi:phosphoribosylformimino-5-aminoimidazole carboxamide ribotide isomerase